MNRRTTHGITLLYTQPYIVLEYIRIINDELWEPDLSLLGKYILHISVFCVVPGDSIVVPFL